MLHMQKFRNMTNVSQGGIRGVLLVELQAMTTARVADGGNNIQRLQINQWTPRWNARISAIDTLVYAAQRDSTHSLAHWSVSIEGCVIEIFVVSLKIS